MVGRFEDSSHVLVLIRLSPTGTPIHEIYLRRDALETVCGTSPAAPHDCKKVPGIPDSLAARLLLSPARAHTDPPRQTPVLRTRNITSVKAVGPGGFPRAPTRAAAICNPATTADTPLLDTRTGTEAGPTP